jgi:hypothetical protein
VGFPKPAILIQSNVEHLVLWGGFIGQKNLTAVKTPIRLRKRAFIWPDGHEGHEDATKGG